MFNTGQGGDSGGVVTVYRYAVMTDNKPSGTQGGAAVSAVWTPRNLNTLVDPSSLIQNPASFTGTGGTNTDFILPAGRYYIRGFSPHYMANRYAKVRLYNVTDAAVVFYGSNVYNNNGTDKATIETIFTLAAQKTIQMQYYYNASVNNDDLGIQFAAGGDEVYSQLVIIKI